jgi:hypothetical protein
MQSNCYICMARRDLRPRFWVVFSEGLEWFHMLAIPIKRFPAHAWVGALLGRDQHILHTQCLRTLNHELTITTPLLPARSIQPTRGSGPPT